MADAQKTWTCTEQERLDVFLRKELPIFFKTEVSNSKIRRLILAGAVSVNGKICRTPAFILRRGTFVKALLDKDKIFFEKQPDDVDFTLTQKDVLYEDDSIICVNKPAFLNVEETIVQGRANLHECVVKYLWGKNPALRNKPYAGIMHRLDRETSGVILFTKTRDVNAKVHSFFEEHTARKTYRAVCKKGEGCSLKKGDSFFAENYIGRISAKSAKCKIGLLAKEDGGLFAHTDFTVAQENGNFLYIDAFPKTGRTHQIRVHLSRKGLPILGDELYGGDKGLDFLNGRIMLHSFCLEFEHPVTGKMMCVKAPLPDGFEP